LDIRCSSRQWPSFFVAKAFKIHFLAGKEGPVQGKQLDFVLDDTVLIH
jgi:hypothetical protein